MAVGSLDIINVLKRELLALKIPASTICALADVKPNRLSVYLNGHVNCPADDNLKLRKAWSQLMKLISDAGMLPLDYRKVDRLRESITAMENGSLQIVVFSNNEHQ